MDEQSLLKNKGAQLIEILQSEIRSGQSLLAQGHHSTITLADQRQMWEHCIQLLHQSFDKASQDNSKNAQLLAWIDAFSSAVNEDQQTPQTLKSIFLDFMILL